MKSRLNWNCHGLDDFESLNFAVIVYNFIINNTWTENHFEDDQLIGQTEWTIGQN